jgi:hypothetical protein
MVGVFLLSTLYRDANSVPDMVLMVVAAISTWTGLFTLFAIGVAPRKGEAPTRE